MKISKQARREAKRLFRACVVNGVLDEPRVRQAVTQVVAQKPRGAAALLSHFQRLIRLELARHSARIENAVETPPAFAETLKTNLTRRYGPGLDFAFAVSPALIGGLRVKVGCDVLDGSIRARLDELNGRF
jgi:F-type H+-transporting ATPase subunit delta